MKYGRSGLEKPIFPLGIEPYEPSTKEMISIVKDGLVELHKSLSNIDLDGLLTRGEHFVVYKDENLLISIPLDYTASKWLGRGCKWCTIKKLPYKLWSQDCLLFRFVFSDGNKMKFNLTKKGLEQHEWSIAHNSDHFFHANGLVLDELYKNFDTESRQVLFGHVWQLRTLAQRVPFKAWEKIHDIQRGEIEVK